MLGSSSFATLPAAHSVAFLDVPRPSTSSAGRPSHCSQTSAIVPAVQKLSKAAVKAAAAKAAANPKPKAASKRKASATGAGAAVEGACPGSAGGEAKPLAAGAKRAAAALTPLSVVAAVKPKAKRAAPVAKKQHATGELSARRATRASARAAKLAAL